MPRRYVRLVNWQLTPCATTCPQSAFAFFDDGPVKTDPSAAAGVIVGQEIGGANGLHFLASAGQGRAEAKEGDEGFVVDLFW